MRSPLIFRIFKNNQLVGVKQFDQDQVVIGHNADVNVDLDSDEISPIHCLIERRDNGYYICDLGSQTGTFKNGQAVLDESISTGDELVLGPFRISFYIGVPKPKTTPGAAIPGVAEKPLPPSEMPRAKVESSNLPPAATVKKEEVKVAPAIPAESPKIVEEKAAIPVSSPSRPEIKSGRTSFKKNKSKKTFAPPSEIKDLKSYLKPSKGSVVQVIVAWKERILTTYHFKGNKPVRVNIGGDRELALPQSAAPKGFALLEMNNGLRVNLLAEMSAELVSSAGTQSSE
ncbi:MAG TPA: FHA domain-containing protein, partial [Bdellovibrio sp.]|nr:FHA domain-containing protein [Bdellovibrio sp.]